MEKKPNEIQIELSPEVAKGIYSNFAMIAHSPNEFFIDFITMAPNMPGAKVQSRIVMTPENAKNLLGALMQNVKDYENTFGEIRHKRPINQNPNGNQGPNGGEIPNPFIMGGKA